MSHCLKTYEPEISNLHFRADDKRSLPKTTKIKHLTHHSTNNRALEQVKILHKYRVMWYKLTPLLDYLQSAGERERG